MLDTQQYNRPSILYTERGFEEHIKLYYNYVKNVNENKSKAIANTYSINGTYMHELFFEQFGGSNGAISFSVQQALIKMNYSGISDFKISFSALAKGLKNKGWVAWIFDELTGEFKLVSMNAHDENLPYNCKVLLILDMYEHAYFMDYGTDKDLYIDNFFKVIDWNVIEKRIKRLGGLL